VPLACALVVAGLLRLAGGPRRGAMLASASIGIGFLVAYVVISGVPRFPPVASSQKLAYVAAGGLLLGVVLAFVRLPRPAHWAAVIAGVAASVSWLAAPRLGSPDAAFLVTMATVVGGCAVATLRLAAARERDVDAPVMLLVACLALAPVAFFGAAASVAQLAGALAAATGGYLLWNWPVVRFPFGAIGTYGAGAALTAMVSVLALYTTRTSLLALALVLPVFFADSVARRVPLPGGTTERFLRPMVVAGIALVPLAAAVGVGYYVYSTARSGGYY